jgi:hypothetical protein
VPEIGCVNIILAGNADEGEQGVAAREDDIFESSTRRITSVPARRYRPRR